MENEVVSAPPSIVRPISYHVCTSIVLHPYIYIWQPDIPELGWTGDCVDNTRRKSTFWNNCIQRVAYFVAGHRHSFHMFQQFTLFALASISCTSWISKIFDRPSMPAIKQLPRAASVYRGFLPALLPLLPPLQLLLRPLLAQFFFNKRALVAALDHFSAATGTFCGSRPRSRLLHGQLRK